MTRRPLDTSPLDFMERLRMLVTAGIIVGGGTLDDVDEALDGLVWLGDLSGMEVGMMMRHEHDGGPTLCLYHRCGWAIPLPNMEGIAADGTAMLGNLVEFAAQQREGHACARREPSAEHRDRLARWQTGVPPTGGMH